MLTAETQAGGGIPHATQKSPHELPSDVIREMNKRITMSSREYAAWLGGLWHAVDVQNLWVAWGYKSFIEAIEGETERGFSTMMEYIKNYRVFVVERKMQFSMYVAFVKKYGTRKTSLVRQANPTPPQYRGVYVEHETPAGESPPTQPIALVAGHIPHEQEIAQRTVKQARAYVAGVRGTQVVTTVRRFYIWTMEQDALTQKAITHVQSRVSRPITPSHALALLHEEYCSEKATRQPITLQEAA